MKNLTEFMLESLQPAAPAAKVNEAEEIKDEKEFRAFAHAKLKEIHGDEYDEKEADEMIDGILADNKELVEKGDWGALVGIVNKGVVKE